MSKKPFFINLSPFLTKVLFNSMINNGIKEDQAIKIAGSNWFHFMQNHF